MREGPNARKKTRYQMTENKNSRKSNFKKKQLPFNLMKQYFASFITKLIKFVLFRNIKFVPIRRRQ